MIMSWKVLIFNLFPALIMGSLDEWSNPNLRIMGGEIANIANFKYQAAILFNMNSNEGEEKQFEFGCGGTLTQKRFVLSAAHCFTDDDGEVEWDVDDLLVGIGSNDSLGINIKSQKIGVKRLKIHESFDSYNMDHDIALLELIEPFKSSVFVSTIDLMKDSVREGTICTASGWGWLDPKVKETPRTLNKINLPILNLEECKSRYNIIPITLDDSQICAGFFKGGRDSCKGDSGGPLVCNGKLAGIISFGKGCGEAGYPGIYTKVSRFLDWIDTAMNSSDMNLSSFKLVLFVWIALKLIY